MHRQTPQKRELFAGALKRFSLGVFACLLLVLSVPVFKAILTPGIAHAATSSNINFQARLQTASGSIVPDGTYNIEFKLYNSSGSTGSSQGTCSGDANCLWTETRTGASKVNVVNGYVTVNLGSVTAFPSNINWDQDLYLTMNIGGTGTPTWDGEMNPRLKLTASAYAFKAGQLAQFNNTTGYTSTLQLLQPTGGNQTFQVQDQGAAGTYNLLTQNQANTNYIQNQNSSAQTSTNFWISGTGKADTFNAVTALQTGGVTRIDAGGNLTNIGNISGSGTLQLSGTTGSSYIMSALGLGTSSPQSGSALTIANGSWLSAVDAAGTGYVNMFQVNSSNQIQVGAALNIDGGIVLPNDSGPAVLVDESFSSGITAGTANSYTLGIGQANALTVYGENDGSGNAQNVRVAIGSSITPAYTLDVGGDVNTTGVYRINGTQICSSSGCTPAAGSTNYIQAQATTPGTAQNTNFNLGTGIGIAATFNTTTGLNTGSGSGTQRLDASGNLVNIGTINGNTFTSSALTFSAASPTTISSAAGQILTVDSGTTGQLNLGTTAASKTIQIGTTATNTGNTQAIGIGNLNAAGTTNVTIGTGSSATAGTTTVQGKTAVNIGAATTPTISIAASSGGTINLGTVGSTANTTTLHISDSTGAAQAITVGGTGASGGSNASSTVALQGGASMLKVQNTGVVVQTFTNSTTAFQVQNSAGTPIFLVDTSTTNNKLTNPGFEVNTTGWAGTTATIARNTTAGQFFHGQASLTTTVTTAGGGATVSSFTSTLTAGAYNFSFYAMNSTAGALGVTLAGAGVTCTLNSTAMVTTGFQRYYCSFTSTGTTTSITITSSTTGVFYLDGVQLTSGASLQPYAAQGAIQLRGTINSPVTFQSTSNSTSAFQIQNAAGTGNLFVADTLNNRIGIGTSTPGYSLDVAGDINVSGAFRVNGSAICTTSCAPGGGSGNYIQNTVTTQTSANFNIDGNGVLGGTLTATGAISSSATINAVSGYKVNGTAGSSVTCSSGNVLGNIVVSGGIVTAGSCAANGGGVSPTLQNVYDNSATANPQIQLSATNGGLKIRDASSTVGNIFQIQNSGGTATYLAVTATGSSVAGTFASSGALTVSSGGASISGGLNNNTGGITAAGSIAGATTISASGQLTLSGTGGNQLAVTGAPINTATSSLFQLGNAIASGNVATNGGTYLGLNAPSTGAGSAADFLNFQVNGVSKLKVDNTGLVNSATGFSVGGTAGVSPTACSGGQVLTNLTIVGGIVTGAGGCATNGGGTSPTLQNVYDNAGTANPQIQLSATNGGLKIRDASSTVGNIFQIQNSAGTSTYFAVTAASSSVAGTFTSSGALTVSSGGASISGGLNNNSGNITNAGSIAGATTISASGQLILSGTGGNQLAVTGAPTNSATSSLFQLGNAIAGGNVATNGGTYLGLNAPSTGAGSTADFLNFQVNGVSKLKVDNTGLVNAATGFAVNGTAGSSVTCSSGNVLGNIVVSGGIVTAGSCAANGGGVSPTLQNVYDNSATANPQIQLSATNGGLKIRDASSTVGNIFQIQNSGGTSTYFAVTASGASVAGTFSASSALQTNGTTRIDASGNLSNIGTISASGLIQGTASATITAASGSAGLTVQGASGQNIAQFKDSTGTTVVASVGASGTGFFADDLNTNGNLKTGGTQRIDNVGNLVNIGTISSGAITSSGTVSGTSINGTTGINTGAGAGTQRIDANGNLTNIGTISSGAITSSSTISGTTLNGTTGLNTGAGAGTQRVDASGNLVNIGNISGSGTLQLSGSSGSSYIMSALGLGTTSPQAASAMTIANGSWIAAIDSTGSGYVNMFLVNSNNEIQVGAALNVDGSIILPTDGGQMTFSDLPISSATAAGTAESYTMRVGSTNALTVYGEADGSGNAQNVRVAIGSSISPQYTLDVGGTLNASGAITGSSTITGTTLNGTTGGINTGAGAGTQRIDASGNLLAIGNLTMAGNLQNTITSTTALVVKTSTLNGLSVDTSGKKIQIGSATTDANAFLLILDSYNTTDPTGTNGAMYYNSSTNKFRCYENSAWKDCIYGFNTITKTADQAATQSSTTMQNDNTLSFAVAANTSYVFDAWIPIDDSNATALGKYTFTVPASAVINVSTQFYNTTAANTTCNIVASAQVCTLAGNYVGQFIMVRGYIRPAGTAGTAQFQFAQNTSTAASFPVIKAGATLSWHTTN